MKSAIILSAFAVSAFCGMAAEMKLTADRVAADRITGAVCASGHVHAVAHPLTLRSDYVEKNADGTYVFANPTQATTCTNEPGHTHWLLDGSVKYSTGKGVLMEDVKFKFWEIPVMWLPWWYQPLDTDYGWRVMPGYSRRWGANLLTRYTYHLAGSFDDGALGLAGSTRFDWRAENGVALGESLKWQLGDFGRGAFQAYYAWDLNADRYDRHWSTRRWNYMNWGSTVPDERYGLELTHRWEATERDTMRVKAQYFSDSYVRSDFLSRNRFGTGRDFAGYDGNELAWEHNENLWAAGVSVSGPLNDFYEGVSRLPEFYFDVAPMSLFSSGFNYESENRVGWLNRDYAKYGKEDETSLPFRYSPGPWADYDCFRLDTYHRLTAPFKAWDVLSVVPRVGYRGTFWSENGNTVLDGASRAGHAGDNTYRSIAEAGVTFAARGRAEFADGLGHMIEPYLDVLAQEANYSGLDGDERPYYFDSLDGSSDWLDQYAGRSRNLPYSWYGLTPGLRNAFTRTDEKGNTRTFLDIDAYASVQLNDTSYTEGGKYHRLVKDPEDPVRGSDRGSVVPGLRWRWTPDDDVAFVGRTEFDCEENRLAYADIQYLQKISDEFKYHVTYLARDHRRWDYSSTAYDSEAMKDEDFNWLKFGYLELGCEQDVCDAFAYSPFVRWDCREGEFDEIGAWFDFRTDCLGFRFIVAYENDYERIDRSERGEDFRCGFFIYLRALGPSSGSPFGN